MIFNSDTTTNRISGNAQSIEEQNKLMLEAIARASQANTQNESQNQPSELPAYNLDTPTDTQSAQTSILPTKAQITQKFGNYNPGIEVFNKSGVNTGVDFGVKEGTPLALPPGKWKIMQAVSGASGKGYIGNKQNSGYGNSILAVNEQTGETLRFSHLSSVKVQPGMTINGGTVIGASGATGNVTGPHLDLEYKDQAGLYKDIMNSPYAKYLFGNG